MAKSGIIQFTTETPNTAESYQMAVDWYITPRVGYLESYFYYNLTITKKNDGISTATFKGDLFFGMVSGGSIVGTGDDVKINTLRNISIPGDNTTTSIYSGSFVIKHNDLDTPITLTINSSITGTNGAYTLYTFDCDWVEFTINQLVSPPYITTAPNFNDEENPTINYYNPMGNEFDSLEACISLDTSYADVDYRSISRTGTSYTFNLTEEERNILRNATLNGSNSRTLFFYIRGSINGSVYMNSVVRTFTVINCEPSISSTFYDIDEECVALTQNSDVFIKGFSNLEFQVEGIPKKGASITNYKTFYDGITAFVPKAQFYNITANNITFNVIDNRGQTGTLTLPIDMVDYFPVSCSFSATNIKLDEEGDGTTATANVEISGKWFNATFGADGVANPLKIEILHTGLEDWFEIPDILWGDNVDGNNYKATFSVHGLNYRDSITFQCRASDKLTTATTNEITLRLLPVFDWSENDFNFNVPVSFQGNVMVDFVVETGTKAMGTNGLWYWVKWNSGKSECYGTRNFGKAAIANAWGSLYESNTYSQDFPPYLFIEAPASVQITLGEFGAGVWLERGISAPTADNTGEFCFVRPTAYTTDKSDVSFHAIGRWK